MRMDANRREWSRMNANAGNSNKGNVIVAERHVNTWRSAFGRNPLAHGLEESRPWERPERSILAIRAHSRSFALIRVWKIFCIFISGFLTHRP